METSGQGCVMYTVLYYSCNELWYTIPCNLRPYNTRNRYMVDTVRTPEKEDTINKGKRKEPERKTKLN